ncbi:alpha/beta hydrolase [uncultured Cohaesibacter sp.]|uniref:alpha/beta hydrolase n=1 Tax=uncultured Cohaesibacter sp. TaxID=1002546 RepID=UPI002930F326|nr:alpha/beta hydrolase [uncultured Cohaesibacter sp.]
MSINLDSVDFVPNYELSAADRAELAHLLRTSNLMETNLTEQAREELDSVSIEELAVPTRVGPSRVLSITPTNHRDNGPLFINIHGGGFVRGYQDRDTVFCAQMANRLGCKILDIDYRLAPEHPFPTGVTECYDVVSWAFENAKALNVDPEKIALGGHSAGANFTAVISLMAIDNNSFKLKAQLLDYPMLDATVSSKEKIEKGGKFFPYNRLESFMILYSEVPENLSDRYMSPMKASDSDLEKMPPAMINIAFHDPLRMEAWRYAARLIENGVDVAVRQFRNSRHGFILASTDESNIAREGIFRWLDEQLNN